MNRKYGYGEWYDNTTRFEELLEKLEDGIQWVYNHTVNLYYDNAKQKVNVRIDPWDTWGMDHTLAEIVLPIWDTWGMDHTLAEIVLPMLVQLKRTKHGAPFVDNEDVPSELHMPDGWYKEKYQFDGETDPNFFARWDYVLDEMIWAFSEHTKDWEEGEGRFHTGKIDMHSVPVDKDGNEVDEKDAKLFRLDRGPNDTSHFDAEGYKAWQNRKKNGFRLFGKYYDALWD